MRKTFPDNVVTVAEAQKNLAVLIKRAEAGEIIRIRRFTKLTDVVIFAPRQGDLKLEVDVAD